MLKVKSSYNERSPKYSKIMNSLLDIAREPLAENEEFVSRPIGVKVSIAIKEFDHHDSYYDLIHNYSLGHCILVVTGESARRVRGYLIGPAFYLWQTINKITDIKLFLSVDLMTASPHVNAYYVK